MMLVAPRGVAGSFNQLRAWLAARRRQARSEVGP
jgi:hypothetical protein